MRIFCNYKSQCQTKLQGNKQLGTFSTSKSMQRELKRLVHTRNRETEASIFGSPKWERSVKKKLKSKIFEKYRSKPSKPGLQGLLPAGTELFAPYKGTTYTATITEEGKILYNGKVYNSPSGAAKTIYTGKQVNGWAFWRFRDGGGKPKELRTLMK